VEPWLHSPYVSTARWFVKHRGKFTTKQWFSNCFIHDSNRKSHCPCNVHSTGTYLTRYVRRQVRLNQAWFVTPGLGIQTRLWSVGGSHELIRHMGCDNVNPIQLVIFLATADMAGVSWMSTVYGNSQHFHHSSLPAEPDKSSFSIFSHYIYTLYLISKSRTKKRESPSSRTRAVSMFKYLLVISIFRNVTDQADTAVRSRYVTGYYHFRFFLFFLSFQPHAIIIRNYVTTAAFTILIYAHIWHHLSDYLQTPNLKVVVRLLCIRAVKVGTHL
jgi:hypothetical protein